MVEAIRLCERSGLGEFSKMGMAAVPTCQREKTNTPPHIKPSIYANTCPPTSRSCAPVSRCTWFPGHITAFHTFDCPGMPISAHDVTTSRAGAAEVLGQCFASVDQCAVAQTWPIRRSFIHQRDHAPHCKSFLCCRVAHRHFLYVDVLLVFVSGKGWVQPLPGCTQFMASCSAKMAA